MRRREAEERKTVRLTSYDRIVNYNLFSFAPNVRAPVPIAAFPEKSRTEIAGGPFNNDRRLFSLCALRVGELARGSFVQIRRC